MGKISTLRPFNIMMLDNEIFYPLYEFDSKYFVNEMGNKVYSKNYNRLLKTQENHDGYYYVILRVQGQSRKRFLHRLIADSMILKNGDRNVINHINKNRKDNRICNLEWVYRHENYLHGVGKENYKKDSNTIRLFLKHEIEDIYTSNSIYRELKIKYPKLTRMTYHDIKSGKTYTDITDKLDKGKSDYSKKREDNESINDSFIYKVWLKDYVIEGNSLKKIAKKYNNYPGLFNRRFKDMNLPVKSSGRYGKIELKLN